jgi:pimeloyl-ACP methyl ester carboxylesterase
MTDHARTSTSTAVRLVGQECGELLQRQGRGQRVATFDPAIRRPIRLAAQWLHDGRREPPGLIAVQRPEWRRAGLRRLAHLVRVHRRHVIEEPLTRLDVPLLVIRGRDDTLSITRWARHLATLPPDGRGLSCDSESSSAWLP